MFTVLTNADIHTMDESNPKANTIVYEGEYIKYVGSQKSEWEAIVGNDALIYDMEGKMVIPGFVDSHVHPGWITKSVWHVRMPFMDTLDEILTYMKEYAKEHSKEEKPFLFFEYYPTHVFDENGPRKEILDEIISDRPVVVQDYGEHMSWLNSKALELMEVTKDTPDPIPGYRVFVRDEDGEPTGFVLEFAWQDFEDKMYDNLGWRPPVDINEDNLKIVLDKYTEFGVTAISDAFAETEGQIMAAKALDDSGRTHLYYDGAVRCDVLQELDEKIEELKTYQKKYGNKHIKFNTMKLFLDGTNESGTGGYLYPMINDDSGENYGTTSLNDEELYIYMKKTNEAGLDM